MCGFVGIVHQENEYHGDVLADVKMMNQTIHHRGPDDEEYFNNENITVGFRRLSIIDLAHGTQPLSYANERYWIVFNGEIYNYVELRDQLQQAGFQFKTDSDTEVILGMYQKYGIATPNYLRGMFAFVIWDTQNHEIFGARDQFGIKPFHYATRDGNLYFASEKKALAKMFADAQVDQQALQNYFTYQYVPDPQTMSSDIKKLCPGYYFIKRANQKMQIKKYFEPHFNPIKIGDESKLIGEIVDALSDSVAKHMRADVTVGSFLSGGVDSSIVVALARQLSSSLKTFSVGFERSGYSEIDVAQETAAKLDVENISKVITPQEFATQFPDFVYYMDDPLADPAAVSQYFLADLASEYCKVALTGEGADEMFGGYQIYHEPRSLRVFDWMPKVAKNKLHELITHVPGKIKGRNFVYRGTLPLEQRFVGNAKIFIEPEKQELLRHYSYSYPYTNVTKHWYDANKGLDPITRMKDIDLHTWLVGDLLTNADRTSMSASLELRTPFVDREVFQVARKIPASLNIAHKTTKYILREAAKNFTPTNVLYRPKLGFPVPLRYWLKDELHDWALKIIRESQVDEYINKNYVYRLFEEHVSNEHDNSRKLWTVLTFMVWHQVYVERKYYKVIL